MEYLISKRDTERANQPAMRALEVGWGWGWEGRSTGSVGRHERASAIKMAGTANPFASLPSTRRQLMPDGYTGSSAAQSPSTVCYLPSPLSTSNSLSLSQSWGKDSARSNGGGNIIVVVAVVVV